MEEKPLQNPNGDSGLKPRVGPHRAYPGLRESSSNPGQTHQILDDSFFNAEGAPYQPWALPKAGMVPRRWRFGMSFRIAISILEKAIGFRAKDAKVAKTELYEVGETLKGSPTR